MIEAKKLIRENLVAVDVEVDDWQEAIRAAGNLMVTDGAV